jgi:hypothetical protein
MSGKWKVLIGCLLVLIAGVSLWTYVNRDEAVYDRILHRQGYEVSLIKANVATSFTLKPEWVPESNGEVIRLNEFVEKKFNTTIVLDEIGRRDNEVYLQVKAIPSLPRKSGHVLSTTMIHPENTYSTVAPPSGGKWKISDKDGQAIPLMEYGTGDGPGDLSSIFIRDEDQNKFDQELIFTFTGYNLYGYKHTGGLIAEGKLLLYIAVVIVLFFAYRRREEQESALGWKLAGYAILGGATLTINAWRIPIGFVIYWLFFRKRRSEPKPNFKLKQFAALMGLFLFISPILWPALQGAVGFEGKSATVRDIPIEELGMNGVWKALAAETYVAEEAKVSRYEAIVANGGKVKEILLELVQPVEEGFVHTHAVYDAETSRLKLNRYTSDEWIQHGGQIEAKHFFRTVDELSLFQLKSGIESDLVKLELMSQEPVHYGIKDAKAYTVDEKGIQPVVENDLPVQGIWISIAGEIDSTPAGEGWAGYVDYLFNVYPRTE